MAYMSLATAGGRAAAKWEEATASRSLVCVCAMLLVDRYGKDIAPYAVALAQKIAEAFHAYAGEDDDEEASMAAVQCVEAMAAVLASLDDNENNVYAQLEPYLRPVLHRVFEESGEFLEYFENGIEGYPI